MPSKYALSTEIRNVSSVVFFKKMFLQKSILGGSSLVHTSVSSWCSCCQSPQNERNVPSKRGVGALSGTQMLSGLCVSFIALC